MGIMGISEQLSGQGNIAAGASLSQASPGTFPEAWLILVTA